MHAGGRGLARRRTPVDRRAKILCVELAGQCEPQKTRRYDQSQVGLRAGASAAQGGAWSRPLRRSILDRVTPTRTDGHDRLPSSNLAVSKQRGGKKRVGGPPPQPSMPAVRQAILDLFATPPPKRCPHCEKLLGETGQLNLPK